MNKRILPAAAAAVMLSGGLIACSGEKKTVEEDAEVVEAEEDAAEDAAQEVADAAPAGPTPEEIAEMEAKHAELAAKNLAAAEKYLAENKARDGVKTTESGLQYEVLEEGPKGGLSPDATTVVDVHYVGTTTDGMEFDSSRARGAAARFALNGVIPGWTEGVQLMSEGDRYRFYIPPELAYGERGTPGGPIGPNSALIFDVELIGVVSPERNLKKAQDFLAENKKKKGVQTTESGLQFEVLSEGPQDGASPNEANIVKVNYEGTLLNGTKFDSSYDRGEPVEFPLGAVIPGWIEGVQLMSVGDKFKFYIPPELGYGEKGTPGGPIGPNEALVFEVELLDIVE